MSFTTREKIPRSCLTTAGSFPDVMCSLPLKIVTGNFPGCLLCCSNHSFYSHTLPVNNPPSLADLNKNGESRWLIVFCELPAISVYPCTWYENRAYSFLKSLHFGSVIFYTIVLWITSGSYQYQHRFLGIFMPPVPLCYLRDSGENPFFLPIFQFWSLFLEKE